MSKIKRIFDARLAYGIVGGLLGVLIVTSIGAFNFQLKSHALLSAPFLSFVAFLLLLAMFHEPIGRLFGRGSVTVRWGNKEFGFHELPEEFDKELSSRLEILEARIESLDQSARDIKKENSDEDETSITQASTDNSPPNLMTYIKQKYKAETDEMRRVIFHLTHTNYKWRNATTLVKKTGLSEGEIERLAINAPHIIVKGVSKSDRVIYRLVDTVKAELDPISP